MSALTDGRHEKTVKNVIPNTGSYEGKNGKIYKHKVIFEDDSTGEYHSKKETCEYFAAGKLVQFDCEVKVNGQWTNIKISPVKDAPGSYKGGPTTVVGSGKDGKYYAATNSLKFALDQYNYGKIAKDDVLETAKKYFKLISDVVGE